MTVTIGRRELLVALGGGAVAWPLVARAQQTKIARIGILGLASAAAVAPYVNAVRAGLRDLGYIRAGRLRALAVTTTIRSEELPDIPTVAEFVPSYEASGWFGVGAPKNTPAEIVGRLNHEINACLADPKMKARLADLGGTVLPGSPSDFGKLIADETEKWAKVIRAANIKAE